MGTQLPIDFFYNLMGVLLHLSALNDTGNRALSLPAWLVACLLKIKFRKLILKSTQYQSQIVSLKVVEVDDIANFFFFFSENMQLNMFIVHYASFQQAY